MRRSFTVILALALPRAAIAAPAPPPPVQVVPPSKTVADAESLALAREIARDFWPDGTAQKVIAPMMDTRSSMMAEMLKTTPKDLGAKDAKDGNKTLGEIVHERDPYFEERLAITNRIMGEEVGKIMVSIEPQLRESVAQLYARRFSKTELGDIATFFRTPSGKAYASRLIPMMTDPEYQKALSAMVPKLMQAMPEIVAKIKKATVGLPPPKEESTPKAAKLPSA